MSPVAVIVVTWNSASVLPGFLAALPDGMAGLDWRLVVADNDSASAAHLREVTEAAGARFVAVGANLVLLVPVLLPFGTAVFSESPVLQAYLADRAIGPIRDVAFAVYFTFAFGIGAFWAFVIGSVIGEFGYPVAFGVMAASYVAAAVLLLAVRERPRSEAAA